MANPIVKPLLLAGILAAAASPAHAVLQISAQIDGVTATCADNDPCDSLPGITGVLQITNQMLGGVSVLVSSHTQTIATTTGTLDLLSSASTQIINNTGLSIPITVAISGTDYTGPVASFSATGSASVVGTPGSDITFKFYGDKNNAQGADFPNDTPGALLASAGPFTATLTNQSVLVNASGPFAAAGPFSFTLWASGTIAPHAQLTSRGQSITATLVPEPGSLLLLGSALAGLGVLAGRRRKAGDAV